VDIAQQTAAVAAGQVTTYKIFGFRWSLWDAVMQGSLLLQLLILLVVVDVFGQDRSKSGLAWLMCSNHQLLPFT
jgi:hypothetical protein